MVKNIVIVGGGTAGWLSAAYLSKALGGSLPNGPKITLIESSAVPPVGVGEATVPMITQTLKFLGFDEKEFMRSVSATFKNAIRFDDWLYAPNKDRARHSYYHAFGIPVGAGPDFIAPYWVVNRVAHGKTFVDYSMIEGRLCDAQRAPKRFDDPDFIGPFSYAYHFDAGLLAKYLAEKSKSWGVSHVIGEVQTVSNHDQRGIKSVELKSGETYSGDLFIDCSGFSAVLIEKHLKSEWKDCSDILFCDSAVAIQVPRAATNTNLPPFTISTAKPSGWVWDIGLTDRRGTGHVYSSRYTTAEEAEQLLRSQLNDEKGDLDARHLKMRVGYRQVQWRKNCVSIGLSAGFAEPLESTGIFLIELALARLVNLLPNNDDFTRASHRFNDSMVHSFESVYDFIKLHYCLSRRDDSRFWLDNRDKASWTDSLVAYLEEWAFRTPGLVDFPNALNPFSAFSFHQVLYGMDCLPQLGETSRYQGFMSLAERNSNIVAERGDKALKLMPVHGELIKRINQ